MEQAVANDPGIGWDNKVLRALYGLVFANPDREVAGILIGQNPRGLDFGLPEVKAAVPAAEGFVPGQAAMFTHEIWSSLHQAMATHHRGMEIVGWYISRPGMGTGTNPADEENHARWFAREGQILMVVDSLDHRAAIYRWSAGRLVAAGEGLIARRYTRAPRPGFPWAGLALVVLLGMTAGILTFLATRTLGG